MTEDRRLDDATVEALLAGQAPEGQAEFEAVASLVQALRHEFAGPAPAMSDDLAAFIADPAGASVPARPSLRDRVEDRRRRVAAGVGSFVATVAGKVVLGGAVAAASVGGLHVADVVDVPGLPERTEPTVVETEDAPEPGIESEHGDSRPDGAGDFGSRVSDDASDPSDPGVDGKDIANEANDFGTSKAKDRAEGTPGADRIPEEPPGQSPSQGPPEGAGSSTPPAGTGSRGGTTTTSTTTAGSEAPAGGPSGPPSGAGSQGGGGSS